MKTSKESNSTIWYNEKSIFNYITIQRQQFQIENYDIKIWNRRHIELQYIDYSKIMKELVL